MSTFLVSQFKHRLLSILFVFSFSSVSLASHVAGGEISYTCIGPNQYQVTLTFYRDCNGIAASATEVINYRSATCGVNASLSLNIVSTTDITPLCPSAASACNGGGGPFGVERIVYTGILNLPAGCSDWILSYTMCCRNGAITNVSSPSASDFYVQTTLNNTVAPCNSSPVFASNPQLYGCVGQTINYQQLATDPDGDVLVYSLVNAMNAAGSSVTYNGGFSGATPFTVPAVINPSTGQITFTPNVPQVAVVAVLVQEYRAGVLIGSMMRDIQFNIVNCTNDIPSLGGINGAPGVYSISTCVNAPLCFTVAATDINAGQAVTMNASNSIAGSTFTQTGSGLSVSGTFCWTPGISDIGTHYITVNAQDNACPLIGQNSQTYAITVIANPNPPVSAGPDVAICEGSSTVLNGVVGLTPPSTTYLWSPAASLATPTSTSTIATPTSTTAYTFSATYADGCVSTDAVLVTVLNDPTAAITPTSATVCSGANFMLTGVTDASGMTFQWFNPAMASLGSGVVSGTTSTLIVTVPSTPGTYVYTLRVTNPITGCFTTTTTSLIVGSPPALSACVNIYASPTGLVSAAGTQADPTSLAEALNRAACNNTVIKLAIGTYTIDAPLYLSSYVTLEGGFNPATAWTKTSSPGATTIHRSAVLPEGAANAQRLVAFYGNSLTGFRLQDITITTAAGTAGTGMSTYGIHLTNCSNYNIVRTQILPGAAGSGQGDNNPATYNSTWDGANGSNGANGITGDGPQCTCNLGADNGGNGRNGGAAGIGGLNALIIGGSATNGGAGGLGGNGRPDDSSLSGFNGNGGTAAPSGGGAGGAGGTGGTQDSNGTSTSNVGNGGTGAAGAAGTNGTPIAGSYVAGYWVPGSATNGTAARGGGGGGGGGGAGRDTDGCDAAGGGGSGGGGGGGGGGAGRGGFGGGSSYGIVLVSNGPGGNLIQDRVVAGAAGAGGLGGQGGNGGNGGTAVIGNGCTNGDTDGNRGGDGGNGGVGGAGGDGGNGPSGVSLNVLSLLISSPLATNDINFNLAAQPVITASNVNCTNMNVNFTNGASVTWNFTASAVPQSPVGASVITQFTTINRYDIIAGANTYSGFHNIAFDGSTGSQIATNAPQIGVDTFQVCQGDFASFSSVYPASTYQWDFNSAAANPGNVQITPSTQFNTPGFFTISLIVTTDCCGTSPADLVYLYVVPNPTATGSGNVAICTGASTTLTLSGLAANNVVSWSPATNITASTSNTITVNPSATTTYIATIIGSVTNGGTTVYGCPRTVSFTVTVNPTPTISMLSTAVTCSNNGSATATMTSPGLYNFVWSTGATTFNSINSTINSLAPGNYSVTATNTITGCSVTSNVFVNPSALQPMLYLQNNTSTCVGISNGAVTLNTVGGAVNYTYVLGAGPAVVSGSSFTQNNLAGGTYLATVTDNNGCISSVLVGIPELPLPTYTLVDNGPICIGDNAIFSVSGSDGSTLTYNIGAGNTTILLEDDVQDIVITNPTVNQTITLVSVDGNCLVPLTATSTIIVDNCGLPIELVSFDGNCHNREKMFNWTTASELNNDYFTLEHSTNGFDFAQVEVIDGHGNSNTSINYELSIQESDPAFIYYRLKQTDFNGENSFSKVISLNCENMLGDRIVVYPIPANDLLNVHFDNDFEGEITLTLIDLLGKQVLSQTIRKEFGNDIMLPVGSLSAGNYMLHFGSTTQNINLPIVHVSIVDK